MLKDVASAVKTATQISGQIKSGDYSFVEKSPDLTDYIFEMKPDIVAKFLKSQGRDFPIALGHLISMMPLDQQLPLLSKLYASMDAHIPVRTLPILPQDKREDAVVMQQNLIFSQSPRNGRERDTTAGAKAYFGLIGAQINTLTNEKAMAHLVSNMSDEAKVLLKSML